jgi:hypothetical protein
MYLQSQFRIIPPEDQTMCTVICQDRGKASK